MTLTTSPRLVCDADGCGASTAKENPMDSDFSSISVTYVKSDSESGVVEKHFCGKHSVAVEKALAGAGLLIERPKVDKG